MENIKGSAPRVLVISASHRGIEHQYDDTHVYQHHTQSNPPRKKKKKKKKSESLWNLLYVVQATWVRLQDGRVVEHFV